jgi:microcystin-dependent protein
MDAYLGEIRMTGITFAPVRWAFCQGQLLPIGGYRALFSLIGTTYGGNGTSNFALPNLQGRIPVHVGTGPGLSPYQLGQAGGVATITLSHPQLASHNHTVPVSTLPGDKGVSPSGDVFPTSGGRTGGETSFINTADFTTTQVQMLPNILNMVGGNQAHNNMGAFLALNFMICLDGEFPPRP